jgi:spore maturation protein CgeB
MALEARDLTALLKKVLIYSGSESIPFKEFLRQWGIENQLTVFNHHPSVKLNPQFYDSLQSTAKSNYSNNEAVQPQGLKILLPSPLYGGSLPVAHYCNDALTALGHKVEFFDANFYYPAYRSIDSITANESHQGKLRGLFTMFVSEMVLAKALEFKPDLVLGVAQSPFTTETLTEFKQMKLPVAFWFVEDFRLFKYWKTFAPLYDYFFVIQKGEFTQLLNQSGVKHHHYLPLAADPQIHRPLDLTADELKEFASDLSFVGAGYYNRHQFFLQLLNEDFKIWGTEWNKNSPLGRVLQRNGQRISTSDCVKIFNATKINLNLHSSSYHTGVNPAGDFLNPRTYEIAACGAFQLVDYRSDLPDMFEIDLEIVAFSDINQLRNKMKYYLTHPEERSAIAEAGRNRVLKQHTYQHRMQELLTIVAENEPRLQTRRENPNLARNLLRASDNDPELKAIFQRFQPDEELNIDKIAANIRKGKGSLTQAEGVFLLMKEFYDWAREKKVI